MITKISFGRCAHFRIGVEGHHAGPVSQVVACIPAIVEANILNQRGHRSRRTPQLLALQIPGRAQIVRTTVGSFQSPFPANLWTFSELLNRRQAKRCPKRAVHSGGAMLSTSYGTGQIFVVPHETVDGVPQGGVATRIRRKLSI